MRRYVGYSGLVGYEGLSTLKREPSLRPVQIMRQFISNLETGNSLSPAYHANQGLSSIPQYRRGQRRITNIPIGITNPISGYAGYAGYVGLGFGGLVV
jgi:hypothetical protein